MICAAAHPAAELVQLGKAKPFGAFDHHHLPELTLYCFNTNTPGLLLYAKLGMTPIALETRVTPWGEPIALFKLRMDRANWQSATRIAA